MPQDVRELGKLVKQKYPGSYDQVDDAELGRQVKRKFPGSYDQFTDTPTQQQPQSFYQTLKQNVSNGAQQGYQALKDAVAAGYDIVSGAAHGDFTPARELGERFARGALQAQAVSSVNPVAYVNQAIGINQAQAAQEERRQASGSPYWQASAAERARLDALAAQDPSILGRITRGVVSGGVQALPAIGAGIVSGGSVPITAAVGALSSLNEPENMLSSAVLNALPIGGAGAIRNVGRGAEQIVQAETGAIPGLVRVSGAVVDEAAIRASLSPTLAATSGAVQQALPGFENAVLEAAGQAEKSVARKVVENTAALYHVPRALMASADASAPLRQSAIFTISNPTMAARAGLEMFRAFKSKNFERIAVEIAQDADASLGQRFGLHLGSQAKEGLVKGEEAFISKYAGKIPLVKQSEQAYTTYLDVMRVQKFKQYKALVDEAGLSQAQTQAGYEAAARWINYATGRGDFGAKVEKIMPLLNSFMFAPKYAMSRFNILNPVYYAKNAATQQGRIILKQQAKELFTFASVVGSTLALAKAAGADVTLNPNDPDFGKIKAGNYRYDLGAGTVQAMRLIYRTGADLARTVRGDKAERGKTAIDVGGRYLRAKLGPVPSWFVDAVLGRTYVGKDYSTAAAIRDRIAPIQWNDWIDAAWQDGIGGVLKTTPGFFGVGVERHDAVGR